MVVTPPVVIISVRVAGLELRVPEVTNPAININILVFQLENQTHNKKWSLSELTYLRSMA